MEKEKEEIDDTPTVDNKPKKKFMLPLVLILILIGAVGYIAYDKYSDKQNEKILEAYQAGVMDTAQSFMRTLAEQVPTCEPIAINETMKLIDIRCLNIPQ